ncbi:uncharacterized protein LOC101857575 [Aplysia californica]|uniref:Uncharacterized protein LOC101857575 n=1 Tax=Aplysia californica TaxID=6500 RepID=A0ABM0JRH6_APLCA|nr:uncharacterized protein LOC101857575 [Aplysia californica]
MAEIQTAIHQRDALKRLMFDLKELQKNPVPNVAATPLEDNMFEWHCNIRQDDIILHMILFFPDNYPYTAPNAEFMPVGYSYNQGASRPGKKGTQICLAMFNDYTDIHTDWKRTKGMGWSPSYTVQTMLMNVVSFLLETRAFTFNCGVYAHNLKIAQCFKCEDCGHTFESPFPGFWEEESCHERPVECGDDHVKETEMEDCDGPAKVEEIGIQPPLLQDIPACESGKDIDIMDDDTCLVKDDLLQLRRDDSCLDMDVEMSDNSSDCPQIVDYISKEELNFFQEPSCSDDLFGFGLYFNQDKDAVTNLKTPCEFLSARSFYAMQNSVGEVHSVWKELLCVFLPLHMQPSHGAHIKDEFEKTMQQLSTLPLMSLPNGKETPITEIVLKTLPNLLTTTLLEFCGNRAETYCQGFFALYRLFLWALDTYPDLQGAIEGKIKAFIEDSGSRRQMDASGLSSLLMLLSFSKVYKWHHVSEIYSHEQWRVWTDSLVSSNYILGIESTEQQERFELTIMATVPFRKALAFQVQLLDLTQSTGMDHKELIQHFDDNFGLPTEDIMKTLKEMANQLDGNDWVSFSGWFKVMNLPVLTEDEIYSQLIQHVKTNFQEKLDNGTCFRGGWYRVFLDYQNALKAEKRKKAREEREKRKRETRQAAAVSGKNRYTYARRLRPRKSVEGKRNNSLSNVVDQRAPAFNTRSKANERRS